MLNLKNNISVNNMLCIGSNSYLTYSFESMLDAELSGSLPNLSDIKTKMFDKSIYCKAKLVGKNIGFSFDSTNNSLGVEYKFKGGIVYTDFTGSFEKGNLKPTVGFIVSGFSSTDTFPLYQYEGDNYNIINREYIYLDDASDNFNDLYYKLALKQRRPIYYDDTIEITDSYLQGRPRIVFDETEHLEQAEKESLGRPSSAFKNETVSRKEFKYNNDRIAFSLKKTKRTVTNERIQALIYDHKSFGEENDSTYSYIECYQQPSDISYNVQHNYDEPSPRGTQQPYRFYNHANAIQLNFSLDFNINEFKDVVYTSDNKRTVEGISLQKIAQTAIAMSRPWKGSGTSLIPKVVTVILPGVVFNGYVVNVDVQYSTDLYGNSPVLTYSNNNLQTNLENSVNMTDYGYGSLKLTFQIAVIDDVHLIERGDNLSNSMEYTSTKPYTNVETIQDIEQPKQELKCDITYMSRDTGFQRWEAGDT